MPGIMRYIDPNDPYRNGSMSDPFKERQDRADAYKKRRKYYDGEHKRFLDKAENEPDDNVIVNIFKQAVDRTLSFLFPAMPFLELAPHETQETPEERWFRQAWEYAGGIFFLTELGLNGALSGHNYVRVLPLRTGEVFPRLINLNPESVITFWRSDDVDTVVWHEISWDVTDGKKTTYYILDVINNDDYWELVQYVSINGSNWEIDGEIETWDHPVGPIVQWKHFPNPNRFYGKDEGGHLGLNDKVNLILSENARINRYHSSPKTIATGVSSEDVVPSNINDLWTIESSDAAVFNLEMMSELAAAQQLAVNLAENFLAESRVVILRGDVKDFQRVTNTGVRTVFMDMLAKNVLLRWEYGKGIQDICRVMSLVAGKGELIPDIVHQDPLPTDDLERVNVAAIERAMKIVSRRTISGKRGYNWDEELERQEAEEANPIFAAPQTGGSDEGLNAPQVNGSE